MCVCVCVCVGVVYVCVCVCVGTYLFSCGRVSGCHRQHVPSPPPHTGLTHLCTDLYMPWACKGSVHTHTHTDLDTQTHTHGVPHTYSGRLLLARRACVHTLVEPLRRGRDRDCGLVRTLVCVCVCVCTPTCLLLSASFAQSVPCALREVHIATIHPILPQHRCYQQTTACVHHSAAQHSTQYMPPHSRCYYQTAACVHHSAAQHSTQYMPPHSRCYYQTAACVHHSAAQHSTQYMPPHSRCYYQTAACVHNSAAQHSTQYMPPHSRCYYQTAACVHNSAAQHSTQYMPPHHTSHTDEKFVSHPRDAKKGCLREACIASLCLSVCRKCVCVCVTPGPTQHPLCVRCNHRILVSRPLEKQRSGHCAT